MRKRRQRDQHPQTHGALDLSFRIRHIKPVQATILDAEETGLRNFELDDLAWFHIEHQSAHHAADAAVGDDHVRAVQAFQPVADARARVFVTFAVFRAPGVVLGGFLAGSTPLAFRSGQ